MEGWRLNGLKMVSRRGELPGVGSQSHRRMVRAYLQKDTGVRIQQHEGDTHVEE